MSEAGTVGAKPEPRYESAEQYWRRVHDYAVVVQPDDALTSIWAFAEDYAEATIRAASLPSTAPQDELLEEARIKMLQHFTPNPKNGCYRRGTPADTDFFLQWSAKLERLAASSAQPVGSADKCKK